MFLVVSSVLGMFFPPIRLTDAITLAILVLTVLLLVTVLALLILTRFLLKRGGGGFVYIRISI